MAPEAQEALRLLLERWHAVSDLRALADITLTRGSERQRLAGVLLAKAPASLRFEALSPFGQPLMLVTVHDGRLIAYDAARHEALVGPANAETTAQLLSLPFDPDDVVGVLAGRPVPPRDLRTAQLLPPDEHGPSLELVGGVQRQRVWMDLSSGVVRRLEISGGRLAAVVGFLRDDDGRLRGFDMAAAASYVTGRVRYQSLELGVGVEAERFELAPPKGAKIQTIR